ncbi:hypothetical protein AGDE_15339 [Angomonas deanei]|uniref:Uncharacterized protein n=1 Tax=Angomonas deanei TaxID=59799 RepID=A0A7G2C9N6_9TRYP|nr:hypothetical protein AGDE_15339 [Angomonas deanei]CAD2215587.1 hypothetical protein, conserved [Angomonas deanei]|eukprot:EPY19248.1 hypothetical protein AGDE_15339 [Angomonas deanei]
MNVDNLFFCWSAWHTAEAYAIYLTGNNNKQNAESTFTLLSAQFIAPKGFATIHHHNHNNNTVSSFLSVEVYSVCCDVSVILTEREVHCLSRVTCTFSFSLLEEVEIFLNEHYYNTSNNNNDNDPDGLFLFDHVCEGKSLLFKDYAVLSHLFHRLHHPDNNNTNNSGYCFHGSGQQLQCYLAPNSLVLRESLLVRLYAAPIAVEDTNRLQTLILPKRTTPTVLWSAVKDSFFSVWKNMNLDEDNDDNNDRSIPQRYTLPTVIKTSEC